MAIKKTPSKKKPVKKKVTKKVTRKKKVTKKTTKKKASKRKPGRKKTTRQQTARASFTEKAKKLFLETLSATGNVTKAANTCGRSRRSMYLIRDKDPEFALEWLDAHEEFVDNLLEECANRARGWDEERYTMTGELYLVKKSSDSLMALLMKSLRREVFGDKLQVTPPVDSSQFQVFNYPENGRGPKPS